MPNDEGERLTPSLELSQSANVRWSCSRNSGGNSRPTSEERSHSRSSAVARLALRIVPSAPKLKSGNGKERAEAQESAEARPIVLGAQLLRAVPSESPCIRSACFVQPMRLVKNETKRVVVWIDHASASIVHVDKDAAGAAKAPAATLQRFSAKPPSGEIASRHVRREAKDFFRKVKRGLKGAKRILIVGPSTAKLDFLRFIGKRSNSMQSRVVGIETLDDRSDDHLLAYAKRYFEQSKAA